MAGKLFVFFLVLCFCDVFGMKLKQVLVLSRHNLRTPLTKHLNRLTPKVWPKWNADLGSLTAKGALLESYMGEYFSAWLKREGLLPDRCPEEKSVHIYANTRQRTKATARAFVEAAFRNCNITVNFKNITEMDPIFNPVLHNGSDVFKQMVSREIEEKLNNTDLNDAYVQLNRITDINNSEICKEDGYCDLAGDSNEIVLEIGKEPNITGALSIGNALVDSFLMSFYEGHPFEGIAWGGIKNKTQWRSLTKVTKENQNARFNLTLGSRDISRPLLKYMKERIRGDAKFTLLVGHDSNLSPVLTTMGFKSFFLPEQFELTPIGSKLVFQKWTDGANDFLKVEFVYQSSTQLRNAEKLSFNNPPMNVTMYLKDCSTDNNGFCPWEDFEMILNDLVD